MVPPSSYADSVFASDTSPIASSTSYPCFQPSAPVIDSTERTAPGRVVAAVHVEPERAVRRRPG